MVEYLIMDFLYTHREYQGSESKIGYRQLLRQISEYFTVLSRKILAKPHSYTYWFVNCYWSWQKSK